MRSHRFGRWWRRSCSTLRTAWASKRVGGSQQLQKSAHHAWKNVMAGNIEMYLRQPLCADAGLLQIELVVAHRTLQGTAPLEIDGNKIMQL